MSNFTYKSNSTLFESYFKHLEEFNIEALQEVTNTINVITSIPYYILKYHWIYFQQEYFSEYFTVKTIATMQTISSVFFNSNYCINFFIYLIFSKNFRSSLCI